MPSISIIENLNELCLDIQILFNDTNNQLLVGKITPNLNHFVVKMKLFDYSIVTPVSFSVFSTKYWNCCKSTK